MTVNATGIIPGWNRGNKNDRVQQGCKGCCYRARS